MSADKLLATETELVCDNINCAVLSIPEEIADQEPEVQPTSSHDGRVTPPNGKAEVSDSLEHCKACTKLVTLNAAPEQKFMEVSAILNAPQIKVHQLSSFSAVEITATSLSGTSSSDPPSLIDEGGTEEETQYGASCGIDYRPLKIDSSSFQTKVESYGSSNPGRLTVATPTTSVRLPIDMIPFTGSVPFLSNYNLLLTKNVEFFQVFAKRTDSNPPPSKVGLRCTHCASLPEHHPAASFFPSTVSSIASGMGTIATRHFIGGRCPVLPKGIIDELIIAKKNSTMQTKTAGHIGMEAYMRSICAQHGIVNALGGGIQYLSVEHAQTLRSNERDQEQFNTGHAAGDELDTYQVSNEVNNGDIFLQKRTESTSEKENSRLPYASDLADILFQKTCIENFWECKECASVPLYWRASGSILYSCSEPSEEAIVKHRKVCKGTERLAVPRNSVATLSQDDNSYIVRIKWDSTNFCEYNSNDGHFFDCDRKDASLIAASLVSSKDKVLTTDFAFFSMQQLFACRLTRSGGSRGALPMGYPGLACKHCAGEPNERRFFYTSAEHLRNSFSHIPSHLMECTKCSVEIKATLATFRKDRNRQKSLLKAGSHKFFIESVWARVHKKRKESPTLDMKDGYLKPKQKKPKVFGPSENKSCFTEGTTSPTALSNQLCAPEDNTLTTDFTFFTTMQLIKCRLERGCGSRPSCPVGFPGLACRHCFRKDGERRFFYTSADHLRNSFSHIPTHLMECKHCPSQVKDNLVALKEVRHKQKSELRPGSHKQFINQIWDKVHVEPGPQNAEASVVSSSICNQGILVDQTSPPPFLSSDFCGDAEKSANTFDLLYPGDKQMTSSYVYYILEQVKPYFLTEQEQGRGDFAVGYPGLVCIHCENQTNARKFFNRAFSQFYNGFSAISSHLSTCGFVSKEVKDILSSLKLLKPGEDAKLKRGTHRLFMERVWARLMVLGNDTSFGVLPRLPSSQQMPSTMSPCQPLDQCISLSAGVAMSQPLMAPRSFYMQVDALQTVGKESSSPLVTDSDKPFVTEFTFLTFMQVARCNLNDVGNGSRSTFDIGFPGLVCKHCATQPGARKFFYRTSEILAANYAHIPNHLLCCPKVPQDIKLNLEEKKKLHTEQKKNLQRGSQKEFFKCIMERMKRLSNNMIETVV